MLIILNSRTLHEGQTFVHFNVKFKQKTLGATKDNTGQNLGKRVVVTSWKQILGES